MNKILHGLRTSLVAAGALAAFTAGQALAQAAPALPSQVIEVRTGDRAERSRLANMGYALEDIRSDKVYVYGGDGDVSAIRQAGFDVKAYAMKPEWLNPAPLPGGDKSVKSTPDQLFHSYDETMARLDALASKAPAIASITSLGKTFEGRDMKMLRISGASVAQAESDKLPVAFYMGCHHAREHLSVEVPMLFAEYLVNNYDQNPEVKRLVDSREIYVAPIINADGHVFDYRGQSGGAMWRKNRRPNGDGTFGTDLNRNYGFGWAMGGSSTDTHSDVYMGTSAFSETETQNVKAFIDGQPRMTVLLTLHTFSELVLYPWGFSDKKIGEEQGRVEDHAVFEKMAKTMAGWNHYTPEQSSDLYIASGDTTDYAYGTHGIFAFTIELSPASLFEGGFYPRNTIIRPTFDANLKPMLYLLEYAKEPQRVLSETPPTFLRSASQRGVAVADVLDLRL